MAQRAIQTRMSNSDPRDARALAEASRPEVDHPAHRLSDRRAHGTSQLASRDSSITMVDIKPSSNALRRGRESA
jgi:hypothetical protein